MDPLELKRAFLAQVDAEGLLGLFDHLPKTGFWIKDRRGRLMANNRVGVMRRMGSSVEADVVGKTDRDFFPGEMAERFLRDDVRVAVAGASLLNHLELVLNSDGKVEWHRTTKLPLRDRRGRLIGSAGVTVALGRAHVSRAVSPGMLRVIGHIEANIGRPIYLKQLALLAGHSERQFERRFRQEFRVSPMRFVIQFRIKKACRALSGSDTAAKEISAACGFATPAAFAAQFKRHMGVTPQSYRKSQTGAKPET